MKLELPTVILLLTIFLTPCPPPLAAAACNQTCGATTIPFPFGFSSGCKIQLDCSPNGTIFAADFPVQSITGDTILINLPATCGRPVEALGRLFSQNYAPTSLNAILLQNCTGPPVACPLPTTAVKANFELECSAKNDSVSCYSETDNTTPFIDYGKLMSSGCRFLFSAISMDSRGKSFSVSLDVQMVRMGWWLLGECRCAENAKCVRVSPPVDGRNPAAYRCQCGERFAGDGFRDGLGCRRRGSVRCNISRYLSGQCRGKAGIGVLAAGIAAGVTIIVSLGLLLCYVRRRSKLTSKTRSRTSRHLTETTDITIPIYSYKEMEKATDSFSDKRRLGNGAHGTVYSGKLSNDEWVAVKTIKHRDSSSIDQVINEIKLLSSVSHPNLVRLLGCSIDGEQILVYEFMPNGTLSQHLQREKGSGLPWPVRLTIAVETAQALSYLHNAMQPPIYHRDVKSSNILLDYNYKSKVADFGLSRLGMIELSHISTAPQGTPGYVDPQYHQHFHLSDKSDVYSFGVVLIEIITAMRVVDFSRPPNEINLAALAVDRVGRGCLDEIIDPFIVVGEGGAWTRSSVHKVAELAFRCLAFERDMRPPMMEVAAELERIRLSKWADSEAKRALSTCSLREDSLNLTVEKQELGSVCKGGSVNSLDIETEFSPVSVQDSWRSDESSPSSNSLMNPVADSVN